jgi:putative phosphoesterase
MRVAVLSDIHGSLAALEAVLADLRRSAPDLVLHGGDLVVNGPRPDEVATAIRESGWPGVVGNTDEMLWRLDELPSRLQQMPRLETLMRVMYEHTGPAALESLSEANLEWLKSLPLTVDSGAITLLHASPGDLWRAPLPERPDDEFLTTYGGLAGRVVVYGHIHRPFVRELGNLTVANSGSVGLTWDGDPRASYLLIDDFEVIIRRVEYDVEADVSAVIEAQIPYASWLAEMRRRGGFVVPERTLAAGSPPPEDQTQG